VTLLICAQMPAQETQTTQTARQYFTEMRDANSFTNAADKYVCFRDDDVPSFVVVASAEDVVGRMIQFGKETAAKDVAKTTKDGLFLRTYFKGTETGDIQIFDKIDGTYRIDFDAPIKHGRMVYQINWRTGRYRMEMYALDTSKVVPAYETSGKCELIHVGDKPSILADKQ
jgi:hypothetical protein